MLVPLIPMASLGEGQSTLCKVDGRNILLVCADGQYFAIDGVCSHAGQSLAGGRLRGTEISCPLHGGRFDIRTGACTKAPATEPLQTYLVLVDGGKLCVEL